MKRWIWLAVVLVLCGGSLTAYQIYPSQKWWMRAAYVKGFEWANWITGNDFPPPDRFK